MVGESFNWSTFGVVDGGQYSGDLVRVTGKGLEGCFTLDSEPGSTLERAMAGAMGGGPMSLSSLARLECLSMKPVTADATSSTAPTLPRWFLKARTVNMSLPGTDEEDRIAAKCFLQKVWDPSPREWWPRISSIRSQVVTVPCRIRSQIAKQWSTTSCRLDMRNIAISVRFRCLPLCDSWL